MTLVSQSVLTPYSVFEMPHVSISSIDVQTETSRSTLTPADRVYDWTDFVLDGQMVTAEDAKVFPAIIVKFDYEDDGHHSFPLIHHFGVAALDAQRQPGQRLMKVTVTYDFARGGVAIFGDRECASAVLVPEARLVVTTVSDGFGEAVFTDYEPVTVRAVTIYLGTFALWIDQ